jgi:hypothetical protein
MSVCAGQLRLAFIRILESIAAAAFVLVFLDNARQASVGGNGDEESSRVRACRSLADPAALQVRARSFHHL